MIVRPVRPLAPPPPTEGPRLLRFALAATAVGTAVGGAIAVAPVAAGAGLAGLLGAVALLRSPLRAELVVAAFWLTFCLYETIWASVTVPGLFYPFYAAFFATVAFRLARGGLRLRGDVVVPYAVFLVAVLASFVGFADPVAFEVLQRVLAYAFGVLVLVQVGSKEGVHVLLAAALTAALSVATWVVVSAIADGFSYRGGVEVDQNVVAFFVGVGLVTALALLVTRSWIAAPAGGALLLLLTSAVLIYALLLLASRGMTLAVAAAALLIVARSVTRDRRAWRIVAGFVLAGSLMLALPGGASLFDRFEGENVESGGSRLPIWVATVDAQVQSDLRRLLLGHGFDASKSLVLETFPTLTSTHNAFLQVGYEFGLIGLAAFVTLHLVLLVRGWRLGGAPGAVMLGLTAFLIGANMTTNASNGFLYWTVLGLVLAIDVWWPEPASPRIGSARA